MKRILFFLFILSSSVQAGECEKVKTSFEKEEAAYDTVARIAITGNSAYAIIGNFIKEGETLLLQCPDLYSLDRQYTLKRKLKKARENEQSYRVFSQSEVARYARTHPEEIIVYKWGTIRSVP
ncbi:MAG: hypothetical protein PF439_00705 [Helicobacteraceae bacterium]|jgi:hypothetical protein|nr:hypothetical protein [Helicobacteraceae bacterium]